MATSWAGGLDKGPRLIFPCLRPPHPTASVRLRRLKASVFPRQQPLHWTSAAAPRCLQISAFPRPHHFQRTATPALRRSQTFVWSLMLSLLSLSLTSGTAAAETDVATLKFFTSSPSSLQERGLHPQAASLGQMLTMLDELNDCGREVEVRSLLSAPLALARPWFLPLAKMIANNLPRDQHLLKNMLNNASVIDYKFGLNISNDGLYALRYECEEGTAFGHWRPLVYFRVHENGKATDKALKLNLEPFDIDLCSLSLCHSKLCRTGGDRGRHMLIVFNGICAAASLALIPLVCRARRSQQESRGWALMEIFLLGASTLYSILLLDWLTPPSFGCCAAVWLRQIGFATFYGSIVLKIYRNLEEYRVRKAQHVSVREEDMLKYLACLLALTLTGLLAWTAGAWGDSRMWKTAWPQCTPHAWNLLWHAYEALFLLYGGRLCYKARNSDWLERWQFTVAVCLEAIVTLVANLIRYSIRYTGHSDTLFTVTFVQLQLTVSVNIVIIIAPKFYLVSGDSSRRSLALGGQPGRAHPSLAKLRDNILNGTIDFAEVPIVDMNPEDIRAELKRVYTQLRMYKLKNLYQDNPHISKRKGGGKRWSDKPKTTAPRRISIPSSSSPHTAGLTTNTTALNRRIEEDEKSDLTVESAPHNVLLSTTCQLQLEPNSSVRV